MKYLRYHLKMKKFLISVGMSLGVMFFCWPALAAQAVPNQVIPNDTFYSKEWAMPYIHAPEAWATATSSGQGVVVAVIDSGVDDSHPDLKGALWVNPDETVNGKDDDGDGLIDDINGWNYIANDASTRPIGAGDHAFGAWEHGTIVASLIAGRGNDDIGMAGIAWKAKIMPIVILGADGNGGTDLLAKAIKYAVDHRADIINLSLEGDSLDPDVALAINEATAKGVLVVIAAGNGEEEGFNMDQAPFYPACHKGADNVGELVVGGIGKDGLRNPTSNYGQCVNISAPGASILAGRPTYDPQGNRINVSGYGEWDGTSLAAPLVSGVAALLKSQHPDWTGEMLAKRILDTAQAYSIPQLGMGRGILDAAKAVSKADALKYGPWQLLGSLPGTAPVVKITDSDNKTLYTISVGNPGDKRGLRTAFVLWDEDRIPDVLVTSMGDQAGEWRVYRTDGVLLAAGKISTGKSDVIKGGLLASSQDTDTIGRPYVLLTEAQGSRIWLLKPGQGPEPGVIDDKLKDIGILPVGVKRPLQSFVMLEKAPKNSRLWTLSTQGLEEGAYVSTTKPANLTIAHGRSTDKREAVAITGLSKKFTYMTEKSGIIQNFAVAIERWLQAPQGLPVSGDLKFNFYDFWPR